MSAHRTAACLFAAAALAAGVAGCTSSPAAQANAPAPAVTSKAAPPARTVLTTSQIARWLHLTRDPLNPGHPDYFWKGGPAMHFVIAEVLVLTPAQAASAYTADVITNPGRTLGVKVLGPAARNPAVLHALQAQFNHLPPSSH